MFLIFVNHCREWSQILRSDSGAKFWSWARLCVDLQRFSGQAETLLISRMIRLVPEIEIWQTDTDQSLYHNQWLLEFIRDGQTTQLKKLTYSGEVLQVAPDIVAGAAMKVETLIARLSSLQVDAILASLAATQDSKLRDLVVCWNPVNFSTLDPEVMAGALVKLERVDFDLSNCLSTDQVTALFSRICNSPDLRLTELLLLNKDISLVPPEVLVLAIQRLKRVHLVFGWMTDEQATAILTLVK